MAKYIDANVLIKDIEQSKANNNHNNSIASQTHNAEHRRFIKMVLDQPTADVVEVKRGEWKRKGQDIYCSVCGNESAYNPFGASKFSDYCPNCGAKMDGTPKERGGEK